MQNPDVVQCSCSVTRVECIRGVNEQYGIGVIWFKYSMHSVYCSLASGLLSSTQLEWVARIDNIFLTLITHFPQILLKTSPTPIGLTAPSPLSSGIRRLATMGSMVIGSVYCVHRVLVIVAIASHSLVDDCLKDLQARILLKPFSSTPDGPLFSRQLAWPSHR